MVKRSSLFRLIVYASVLLGVGCATRQEVSRTDNRISNLELRGSDIERSRDQFQQRMEDFRKSQIEKEQQLRTQYAELYATVDRLQEQIQLLNGKIEEKNYRQNTSLSGDTGDSIETRVNNLEQTSLSIKDRLLRIEEYLALDGGVKKPTPPPAKTVPEKPPAREKADIPPAKEMSENELYAKAKQDFDAKDLETARAGFQEFLKRYPKSAIAGSAQFWVGEIYYQQKWYEKAILEYQKVIENYPKGDKVQFALLKQGLSFYNLGDKSNARLILKELINKYPSSNEAKIAKRKLEEF
ncbi:MAG: tol-pal system protein YbgF [Deltaproteobacteria bacterium]|nr:tol-pal system protein YbgF [Deltaproteobacteria bacterium]